MTSKLRELEGWLLDLYPDPEGGLTVWVLGEDGGRYALRQDFPIRFYAAGASERLRALWLWLQARSSTIQLSRTERRDLFNGSTTVLAAETQNAAWQPRLCLEASQVFPDLTWYDTDLRISLRHAALYGTFPLCHLRVEIDEENWIKDLKVADTPWDLDPRFPPLRCLKLEPDVDPAHAQPKKILAHTPHASIAYDLEPARPLLIGLNSTLKLYDPDLILSAWGDTWLLPTLLKAAQATGLELALNRDPGQSILHKPQRSYFAYGQVIYRGQQIHLHGRCHIDINNTVMYHDYGLEGVWELSRLTALPIQTVARVSPGTGISSMQITTALKQNILVPWHKQQAESQKTAMDLLRADMGGMVYQPTIGLHPDVAEIDFISMYPSIMARFNISPETVLPGKYDPKTGLPLTRPELGLVPQTLDPLLEKRIAIKMELLTLSKWDVRYKSYKAKAAAHKWLLVTCFGYLGYKNARFGKIEAHEAVTAYGREALLRAKEAAEGLGFEVLHMYVDGMWIKKPGCRRVEDFQTLLDAVLKCTGLPIALDGVYRWVAFLSSRVNARVPVANRYFGVFQSGEIKSRGIDLRRHDTPKFITRTQEEMLELFSQAPDMEHLTELLPGIRSIVKRRLSELREGRVPVKDLIVRQTLSRVLSEYRSPSPAAIAATELETNGKHLEPGQSVRLIYTRGRPKAHAWDGPIEIDPRTVDTQRYAVLLMRAIEAVLEPIAPRGLETCSQIPLPRPTAALIRYKARLEVGAVREQIGVREDIAV